MKGNRTNHKFVDLSGQRFGRYTVLHRDTDQFSANGKRRTKWVCKCDCGNVKSVGAYDLRAGHILSCGCYKKQIKRAQLTRHGAILGGKPTRLYRIWDSMKARCYDPNKNYYSLYGGRGIQVCNEWRYSFEAFQEWALNNGYDDTLTIDRIDADGNYCPENCRWSTIKEQNNNKRDNHYLTYKGETKTLAQWSEVTGFPYHTLSARVRKWKNATAEDILLTPRKIDKNGHRTFVQSKLTLERMI